jgi:hypothetical protein
LCILYPDDEPIHLLLDCDSGHQANDRRLLEAHLEIEFHLIPTGGRMGFNSWIDTSSGHEGNKQTTVLPSLRTQRGWVHHEVRHDQVSRQNPGFAEDIGD